MEVVGFLGLLASFAAIGLISARRGSGGDSDYLLADRAVSPLFVALSAAATKNSGYMFIALMGYIYTFGLSAVWLVVGFFFGDLVAFCFVHARVRQATSETGAKTFPELLSRWGGGEYRALRSVTALLILVFLSTYAAAQFSAGGKALHVLFGWPEATGAVLGASVVLVYCWSGGLRASIWTDVAQSLVMMVAMLALLAAVLSETGGVPGFLERLRAVSPTYMDLGARRFGGAGAAALFAFGWLFNGLGVTGQPQVMIRFMALSPRRSTWQTGIYYFTWTGLFLAATFLVGLATRLFVTQASGFDAELALPLMAHNLIPGVWVGVIIAGVFAASLSTADSQILSCAAALSDDLRWIGGADAARLATAAVVTATTAIALFASASVFTLVIFSWSALACALGPLVIVQALGARPTQATALAMAATGLVVALSWRQLDLDRTVYEGLPGMAAAFAIFAASQLLTPSNPKPPQ